MFSGRPECPRRRCYRIRRSSVQPECDPTSRYVAPAFAKLRRGKQGDGYIRRRRCRSLRPGSLHRFLAALLPRDSPAACKRRSGRRRRCACNSRARLAAQIAIDALVVDVIRPGNVFRIFVCGVSHKVFPLKANWKVERNPCGANRNLARMTGRRDQLRVHHRSVNDGPRFAD